MVKNGTISKKRNLKHCVNPDHPVCAVAVASHLFLDGAATPPVSGGELIASLHIYSQPRKPPPTVCTYPMFGRAAPASVVNIQRTTLIVEVTFSHFHPRTASISVWRSARVSM